MKNPYERILKLRRWRDLRKTLRANQRLEEVRAAETPATTDPANKSRFQQPEIDSGNRVPGYDNPVKDPE